MTSTFPLSPPMSHHKSRHAVGTQKPIQQQKQDWNMASSSTDAPRTVERKRRGRMVDYIDSLPTPPSTKNTRSRHIHSHDHLNAGLPTPSTSTRKTQLSTTKHDHRASPIARSRHLGTDGVDLQAEAGEDSGSSSAEEDVQEITTLATDKRWIGRRGTRRAGLTFAQQMGLLVARSTTDTHQISSAVATQSEWQPTGIPEGREEDGRVEKSFYFNAASVSKRELLLDSGRRTIAVASGNPFLDETDRASSRITSAPGNSTSTLRKTASGRLLDPVDLVVSSSSTTSIENQNKYLIGPTIHPAPDSSSEHAGSDTEKEEMEDEEEDDSPYLIEDFNTGTTHTVSSERVASLDVVRELDDSADELEQVSSSGEMTDEEEDELESAAIEVDEGRLSPVLSEARSKGGRKPSITRYLSAVKGSSLSESERSPLESPTPSDRHVVHRRQRSRSRERKMWGKPIAGDADENPFLASSTIGKPVGESASSSWLRTDNARARRNEGEKPTIDYLFRGQKTTFANPYYQHDPYRPPATSLLPLEHPEFSPAPVPAPRVLFPQATFGENRASEDEHEPDVPRNGRRDILPGRMGSSPSAAGPAVPAARTLQRRISSQIPPLARQGSTLLEKAQRAQTAQQQRGRLPAQSQPVGPAWAGKKRSMEAVLGGMDEANDEDDDELLLKDPRAGRRLLFGAGSAASGPRTRPEQQRPAHAVSRPFTNKKIKMEHVMGE